MQAQAVVMGWWQYWFYDVQRTVGTTRAAMHFKNESDNKIAERDNNTTRLRWFEITNFLSSGHRQVHMKCQYLIQSLCSFAINMTDKEGTGWGLSAAQLHKTMTPFVACTVWWTVTGHTHTNDNRPSQQPKYLPCGCRTAQLLNTYMKQKKFLIQ